MDKREPVQSMAQDAMLAIYLLGRFRVRVAGRWIADESWRLRKAKRLIARLALAPDYRLHREEVIELLWPELGPDAAANNLRRTLHEARRTLAPPPAPFDAYVRLQAQDICLVQDSIWVDVTEFVEAAARARRERTPEAFRRALMLYGGDLLPEERYEEWAIGYRESLRGDFFELSLGLADVYERRNEPAAAIEALRAVLAREPAHEDAHVRLMRLYVLTGQRHHALRQYRVLKETMRRELDVEPAEASQRLYRKLVQGQWDPSAVETEPTLPVPGEIAASTDAGGSSRMLSSHDGRPENLTVPLTPFIGRRHELATVAALLAGARLVTLTGVGGCGKSRLGHEVARTVSHLYRDGVRLADLSTVTEAGRVPAVVAAALGAVVESPGARHDMLEDLRETCRGKHLLLVLDNSEHVVNACRDLVQRLFSAAPELHVLVTGRQALGIPGEVTWVVPHLSLPGTDHVPRTVDQLARYDAIALFVECARRVQPGFALTDQNADAIVRICRRLEGNALAITLAAHRMGVFTPDQVVELLMNGFHFLSSSDVDAPARHRSMRATVEWSCNLLSSSDRTALHRLAVFRGGFCLAAAAAVAFDETGRRDGEPGRADVAGSAASADGLASLAARSVIVPEPCEDGSIRYRVPEAWRRYAYDRLVESGEADAVHARHAAFYAALAEKAHGGLATSERVSWLARLERDYANIRAALRWSLERNDMHLIVRFVRSLWRFWFVRDAADEDQAAALDLIRQVGDPWSAHPPMPYNAREGFRPSGTEEV